MKKIFAVALVAMMALTANAQNEEGQISIAPTAGINFANITNSHMDSKVGLVAGVNAEYGIADNMGISAGLFYSQQGAKLGDAKVKYGYLNIPMLFNYYIIKGLAVKAGVQPGIQLSAKSKLDGDEVDVEADIKDNCKGFDLSIPVGASYEYQNFVLDARYNIGVTKTFKGDNVDGSKNSVFQITLGYKFKL